MYTIEYNCYGELDICPINEYQTLDELLEKTSEFFENYVDFPICIKYVYRRSSMKISLGPSPIYTDMDNYWP